MKSFRVRGVKTSASQSLMCTQGDLVRMLILLQQFWAEPEIGIFNKLLIGAEAAGPQTTV